MADQERVQILLDKDLKNKIDARAKLEGMNRSELIRLACEMYSNMYVRFVEQK